MSFFDRIKKEIGVVNEAEEENIEEGEEKPSADELESEPEQEPEPAEEETATEVVAQTAMSTNKKTKKMALKEPKEADEPSKEKWPQPEGQLAVDVYQTPDEVVIQSTIAGVDPENIEVFFEDDMVIIEGQREQVKEEREKNYFYQECYWGAFSRKIVLPEEVDVSRAEAAMEKGVLTIRIPRAQKPKRKKLTIKS
ncbi:MAG: Hsp20/alpha crystallin family protein, partial [Patescibacteria group bacterium]